MLLSGKKKNNVYPCKPQFYYIKVGFKGVKIIKACFRDDMSQELKPCTILFFFLSFTSACEHYYIIIWSLHVFIIFYLATIYHKTHILGVLEWLCPVIWLFLGTSILFFSSSSFLTNPGRTFISLYLNQTL